MTDPIRPSQISTVLGNFVRACRRVKFRLSAFLVILDSSKNCLLFEESQTINVKNGIFALNIGAVNEASGLDASIEDAFKSDGNLQGKQVTGSGNCSPQDYERMLAMSFSIDGGQTWEAVNPTPISAVPRAIEARISGQCRSAQFNPIQ